MTWSYDNKIYRYLPAYFLSPLKLWVWFSSVTSCLSYNFYEIFDTGIYGMSVVFSEYFGFPHQYKWHAQYSSDIVDR